EEESILVQEDQELHSREENTSTDPSQETDGCPNGVPIVKKGAIEDLQNDPELAPEKEQDPSQAEQEPSQEAVTNRCCESSPEEANNHRSCISCDTRCSPDVIGETWSISYPSAAS
ncbi:MAG: hypothetical protein LBB12_02325, partial [Holosporaceae bacterium]|nr:hypothetical protein [Holosporaceae bacterium]